MSPTARPSGKTEQALLDDCCARGIFHLELKTSSDLNVQHQVRRAVATYSDNTMENFLRYGTVNATRTGNVWPRITQGDASILDCVLQAEELFGDRWMIMATP